MKEQILKLREEGKTYNEIKEILGCSKGTISYHCGDGQKEKTYNRNKKRSSNILISKIESFKERKTKKDITESVRKFQKRDNTKGRGDKVNKDIEKTFNLEDVINKFGIDTTCYLSGEKINMFENTYQLDHIIPSSRGGDNSLDNMGVTHKTVNIMKSNLTPEEFLFWCKKILEYNNYEVIKCE